MTNKKAWIDEALSYARKLIIDDDNNIEYTTEMIKQMFNISHSQVFDIVMSTDLV